MPRGGAASSSSSSSSSKAPRVFKTSAALFAAMDTKLMPIVHLQVRARELLVDQLAFEGVSEQGRADADALAKQLWSFGTADTIMESIKEILPAAEYKSLLAFCHNQYPILYSTLPCHLKGFSEHFSWPQHSSFYKHDMLASAAQLEARANQSHHLARSQVRGRLKGGANEYNNGGAGVRVDGTTSGPSGAVLANKGGQRSSGGLKLMTRSGKRAFKRAIARANSSGKAHYRGRVLYPTMQRVLVPRVLIQRQQPRLQFFSWNAGGLSSEGKVELDHYLDKSRAATVLVQETHWTGNGEWTRGDWTYVHIIIIILL